MIEHVVAYLVPFPRYSEWLGESRKCFLVHMYLAPRLWMTQLDCNQDGRSASENSRPKASFDCLAMHTACDGQTDKQTNGQIQYNTIQ